MSKAEVIVLDFWASPFAMRAKISLKEKGVEFEARHEDQLLTAKSELLLQSNPIYKKIPVLLHGGKAVCESLVILEYIEETWPEPALLPRGAYVRSVTRFWADFVDKKLIDSGTNIWKSKGKGQEEAVKVFLEEVKQLEGALGEQEFFGGKSFGFLDLVVVPLTPWFYVYEQCGGFKVEETCPKFSAWMKKCAKRESVAAVLPEPEKVYQFSLALKKMKGIE